MDHLRIAPNLIMFLYFLVCEIFRFIDLAHQQAGKYDSTYGIVFSYPFTDYHMERSSAYDNPATAHRNRDRPHRLHHTGGKKLYLSKPNASGMLRMLEQELVYEIFSRTNAFSGLRRGCAFWSIRRLSSCRCRSSTPYAGRGASTACG